MKGEIEMKKEKLKVFWNEKGKKILWWGVYATVVVLLYSHESKRLEKIYSES